MRNSSRIQKHRIFVLACIACILPSILSGYVLGSLVVRRRIFNVVLVKTMDIEIYLNPDCTVPLHEISWGPVFSSEQANKTVYIKNLGNSIATVNVSTSDWTPAEAQDYVVFSASPNNFRLLPQAVVKVVLNLEISADIQGITILSFNVWVAATK